MNKSREQTDKKSDYKTRFPVGSCKIAVSSQKLAID